ncbi:MAG: TetR/AcrR family transcriptional regulator [Anaerolineae bacterium]
MSKKRLDPRIVRTRQLLRTALLQLIHERGLEAVNVQDITERATLNRATFYLHYTDKDDLLLQTLNDVLDELTTLPMPVSPTNPSAPEPERIGAFFVGLFQHVANNADFYRIMLGADSTAAYAARIQAYVEDIGLRWFARSVRHHNGTHLSVSPELMVSVLSGAYIGMIKWWLKNEVETSPEQMADQFLRLVLPGIIQVATSTPDT